MQICRQGFVSGRVQGVGFRQFVRTAARGRQVNGWAKNLADGRVEVLLCGQSADVDAVAAQVGIGPAGSRVDQVQWREHPIQALTGFETA